MASPSIDFLFRRHLSVCGVFLEDDGDVQANLAAAIEAVGADSGLRDCLHWLKDGFGTPDQMAFADELLRIYHKYDDCLAGNLACSVSDRTLVTLLRQADWSEYVVYNLCGLALYERQPVEFHSEDTLDAFVQAIRQFKVNVRLRKERRYYERHTTGDLGEHGLGRGWAWSNVVFGGTPVTCLLWPAGGDDLAEIEDDIGFNYEVGLHRLLKLGIDDTYLSRVFERINTAGRRRSIPALLSLDYATRHLAQEKQYARTSTDDGRLRVARFCPQYVVLWELAENGFLQYHYDVRHRENLGPRAIDAYLLSSFTHRVEDVGAEMATGEMLNTVASMLLEAFTRCGNLITACFMVWREYASWHRHEILSHRTSRTTGEAIAAGMWALTAYRHPCEEWAAIAWRAAGKEIKDCGPLFLRDEPCRLGLAHLFEMSYTLSPDDVMRNIDCACDECADIQRNAHKITQIADVDDWPQQCEEIREWIARCVLHLTICERSNAYTKREIEIRLAWEYFISPKCLATMVGSILCSDPSAGVASDRPTSAITLPNELGNTQPVSALEIIGKWKCSGEGMSVKASIEHPC